MPKHLTIGDRVRYLGRLGTVVDVHPERGVTRPELVDVRFDELATGLPAVKLARSCDVYRLGDPTYCADESCRSPLEDNGDCPVCDLGQPSPPVTFTRRQLVEHAAGLLDHPDDMENPALAEYVRALVELVARATDSGLVADTKPRAHQEILDQLRAWVR